MEKNSVCRSHELTLQNFLTEVVKHNIITQEESPKKVLFGTEYHELANLRRHNLSFYYMNIIISENLFFKKKA